MKALSKMRNLKLTLLAALLLLVGWVQAQQISFQRHYDKGDNAYITAFTELNSHDLVIAYTKSIIDTTHLNPNTMELHLLRTDRDGNELWDKLLATDTTRSDVYRFTTQNISDVGDGSVVLDITYPFGEKYVARYDASGNQNWRTYLNNSFGDYFVNTQLIKQKGCVLFTPDGQTLSLGASFASSFAQANLSVFDANGKNPYEHVFYNGYFSQAYYLNFEHVYALGVEQGVSTETLVFSDLRLDGGANFHSKITHKAGEKIKATAFWFGATKVRVAESISKFDTAFYVNIYEFTPQGKLTSTTTIKRKCIAAPLNIGPYETSWVLGSRCNADAGESVEKVNNNGNLVFNVTDSFDNILQLQKLKDDGYLIGFSKGPGMNLWKLNSKGTLQTGTLAEGLFYPNPARSSVTFAGNTDTYNHSLEIRLCDMLGNTVRVYNYQMMQPVELNLSGLREGVYAYRITTDAGVKLKGKLVICQKN